MHKCFLAATTAAAISSIALAQGVASVDLLTPLEAGDLPTNARVVDVFFDVALTDVWTAAGIRAIAQNGAAFIYFDSDTNTPGLQPGLFNGGLDNRFTIMLSRPRNRSGASRFTNAGAVAAGAYDPPGASPVTLAHELNVAYFASPPATADSPASDGYIARLVIDITGVTPIHGAPITDYTNWAAGPISNAPAGSVIVLQSTGLNQPGGTATATFDVPELDYSNWAIWYAPEPTSLALLALGGLAAIRRR